jgi:hypothetical protein
MILDNHHYTARKLMREVGWLQQWYFLHRERISAPDLVSHFPDFSYATWATMKAASVACLLPSSCRNYFIEVW